MIARKLVAGVLAVFFSFNAEAQTEVTFYTSMGNFEVELTDGLTPITVDSFLARAGEGFYDGTIFHRVIDNFMIQGGDPLGTGFGGPGYTIPDEFHPTLKNVPKALAMANSGPNSGGSQFFINLVTNNHLNNKHTVFGMVTTGFNIVQDIGNVATNGSDRPLTDVVVDSIRVTKFPTSIAGLQNAFPVSVYPNPTRGPINVELPEVSSKVEVYNTTGQIVYSKILNGPNTLDLGEIGRGLYLLRVTNRAGVAERKIILQ